MANHGALATTYVDAAFDTSCSCLFVLFSRAQNSLSLPGSPLIERRSGTRASQRSLKRRVLRSPRMNDRTPLVFPGPFDVNFPYADASRAVTPSQEDIFNACNGTYVFQVPRRRLSSSTSHKSNASTHSVIVDNRLVPRSRRASFTTDHNFRFAPDTGTKTGELLNRRLFGNQEPTHFTVGNNFRHSVRRGVPDVVVDRTRENASIE